MVNLSPFWPNLESKSSNKDIKIGFADATDTRIQAAVEEVLKKNYFQPVLINSSNPNPSLETSFLIDLLRKKQEKMKTSDEDIQNLLNDSLYQGIALLLQGKLDGLLAGATRPTADVVKACLHLIGPKPGLKLVSGQFFIETDVAQTSDQTPFLFADCAVIPEPSPRSLASIAITAAESYQFFTGKKPHVALLSFSTRGSAEHPLVDRIRKALEIIKKQKPELNVDGEIQVDAVMDRTIARIKKADDSPIIERANVFIFPTLESGNIGYKLIQRYSRARIAGPILWGLQKPVSDLSRGCTVQEVIDSALCIAQMTEKRN